MDYKGEILPFYMTYPISISFQKEDKVLRDLDYVYELYPKEARRIQKRIASILDTIDYEGSMIYDEFPDRCQLYSLSQNIQEILKREELEKNESNVLEKWEWMTELIQILLFYEVYSRRVGRKRGSLKF